MELSLNHPTLDAFRSGVKAYQPVCPGLTLEPETGDPAVTARNLHALFFSSSERRILDVIACGRRPGPVLIVFNSGEVYLAAGFSIGENSDDLARFLVEHTGGTIVDDFDAMREYLQAWPTDLAGPVHIPSE